MRKMLIIITLSVLMALLSATFARISNFGFLSQAEPQVIYSNDIIAFQVPNVPLKAGAFEIVDLQPNAQDRIPYYQEKFQGICKIAKVWEERYFSGEDEGRVIGVYLYERERRSTQEKTEQMIPYFENESAAMQQVATLFNVCKPAFLAWQSPIVGKLENYNTIFESKEPVEVGWNFADNIKDFEDGVIERQTIFKGHHISLLVDYKPLAPIHLLLVTNLPKKNVFALDEDEFLEVEEWKDKIIRHYRSKMPDMIVNTMIATHSKAGQSIGRFHLHLVLCDGRAQEVKGTALTALKMTGLTPALDKDEIKNRVKDFQKELRPVGIAMEVDMDNIGIL